MNKYSNVCYVYIYLVVEVVCSIYYECKFVTYTPHDYADFLQHHNLYGLQNVLAINSELEDDLLLLRAYVLHCRRKIYLTF